MKCPICKTVDCHSLSCPTSWYEDHHEHSDDREPTDDEVYNRVGVEGGIGYPLDDGPGSLGEHDFRL